MLHLPFQPVTGTILVADDQPLNRELLEELLTTQGFKVISAPDGAAALQELSETQVDLVLMDVMMPRLNGFEVCEKIKTNPGTYLIPVVLITALSDKQDRIEGIKVGADDFLTRPVDRTELLARVQSLLKLKSRTDELERAESVLFLWPGASRGRTRTLMGTVNACRSMQRVWASISNSRRIRLRLSDARASSMTLGRLRCPMRSS